MSLTLGVVASAGGSVFEQLVMGAAGSGTRFALVTDRPCGAEHLAAVHGVPHRRFELEDARALSAAAHEWLVDEGASAVLLLFSRLVGPDLFTRLPTFNVHPSLLPAFPGFGALSQARDAGVRVVGATLHLAIAAADAGPIVAQAWTAVGAQTSLDRLATLSFVQKTRLALLLLELLGDGALAVDPAEGRIDLRADLPADDRSNPALRDVRHRVFLDELERATA